jgi:cytochrome c peroxidase
MRRAWAISFVLVCVVSAVLSGCAEDPFPTADELTTIQGFPRLAKPPADPSNRFANNPEAAALGTALFHDEKVSGCGTVSCASCHPAPAYTVDTPLVHGCGGDTGRNPPTVLNVGFGEWFMWDGRKDSLWDQPSGPLLSTVEMAQTPAGLRTYLQSAYASEYASLFGKEPKDETDADQVVANFGKALEAYMRTIVRVKAPFDDQVQHFLESANNGTAAQDPFYLPMKTFVRTARCSVCHKGPQLSDGLFHNLGLDEHGKTDHGRLDGIAQLKDDPFNAGGEYSDDPTNGQLRIDGLADALVTDTDGAFKTATLRNVALTGPYMHSGSLTTLDDVIDFYDRGGDPAGSFNGTRTATLIPLHLTTDEKAALKSLLTSLTGTETP